MYGLKLIKSIENMKYEYWFANLRGISDRRKREIREKVTNLEELYYIEETALKQLELQEKEREIILKEIREWDLNAEYQKLEQKGVQFVPITDIRYPKKLLEISAPPYALYVRGKLPDETKKTVAIVGARECSPYGESMAGKFAKVLAEAGIQIVSGMARGVDSAGQRGALSAGGESFGILGCGVDICYPRDEIGLFMELQENGGVISEFPLGTRPLPQHFPARNRIISGLSDAILVIEAKEKSGSLITADMALEQGKDVYALPGPINSNLSKGCNLLIRQGAGVLLSPEDLLEEWGISFGKNQQKNNLMKFPLESAENIVYSCLDFHPKSLEQLMTMTNYSVAELLDILVGLELKGLIKEISKNYYTIVEENSNGTLSGNRGIACKSKND